MYKEVGRVVEVWKSSTIVYDMQLVYLLVALGIYGHVFAASRGYVEIPLERSSDSMYYVESLRVGKRQQELKNVILDTGSADVVLTGSTYQYEKSLFTPEYVAQYGSSEPFEMFQQNETISGNGWAVKGATFGVTNVSDIDSFYGVFGIGYAAIEAMDPYENFPMKLESLGLIDYQVYSVSGRASHGSIVFGGIDSGAYKGPLVKTQIGFEVGPLATREYHTVTAVTVSSIKVASHNSRTSISTQKLIYTLDTGSNGLMVPEPVYTNLVTAIHAKKQWHDDTPLFHQDGLAAESLTFDITGFPVSIPLTDLIDECTAIRGAQYCTLRIGIVDIGTNSYVATLPNSIFKYIYTVFDLQANQVFMAPYAPLASKSIKHVSNTHFPVETTTAPNYNDVYSTMYQSSDETTVHRSSSTKNCRR